MPDGALALVVAAAKVIQSQVERDVDPAKVGMGPISAIAIALARAAGGATAHRVARCPGRVKCTARAAREAETSDREEALASASALALA
jgi:hypothetical protein